jgi:hypothetical protein
MLGKYIDYKKWNARKDSMVWVEVCNEHNFASERKSEMSYLFPVQKGGRNF